MIIMLFPILLLLQLPPTFSEHYKIHPPNWDDISQSLGFHLLPKEFDNDDNKETGNDDGKSSSSSPPFSECGISEYEPPMANNTNIQMDSLKIHNGHIVPNAEAMPWMATVWYNGTYLSGEWCTASVISKWHILMAAHCILPYYAERPWTWPIPGPWGPLETDSFPVVVGTTNFNDSSAIHHRSRRVLPHPDYRMFWFSNFWHLPYFHYLNDIAIIELAEPLEFSSKIRPICLSKKEVPEPQKDAIISGWGAYNETMLGHSILLRVGRNEILNASGEECQGWASKLVGFQANKSICTQDQGGTFIMDGDSGSPLMVKMDNMNWTQIGIATGGYGHFGLSPINMAAFVRVSAYCDWIEKTTAGIVKCT